MKRGQTIVGLDLETNGTDIATAAPIQIGIYLPNGATYETLIYWPITIDDWSEEAEKIHGLSQEDIRTSGRSREWATRNIQSFFESHDIHKPWPVGFNVGGFDMAILQHWMPELWLLFSRRTVDLNALCMYLGSIGLPRIESTNPWRWDTLKKRVKRLAKEKMDALGIEGQEHDALYDATLAYFAWEILQDMAEPWVGMVGQAKEGLI